MIDPENAVYTVIRNAVKENFRDATVSGVLELLPSDFPAVFIEMSDCYPYRQGADGDEIENFCVAVFEVNIFANTTNTRKAQAKSIQRTVDAAFNRLGFQRTMCMPVNGNDATRYRLVSRYEAVVSKDLVIYRR